MEVIINGRDVLSPEDFYKQLSNQVPELGEYFGNNLDALWDYIDVFDGKTIIWKDFLLSEKNIGLYVYKILNLFKDRDEQLALKGLRGIELILL